MELKREIEKELTGLFEGFIFSLNKGGFEFSKTIGSVKYVYGGNLRVFPDKLICDHFNAGICFLDLEDFITPILIESEVKGRSTSADEQWTIDISKNHKLGKPKHELLRNLNLEVFDNADVLKLKERLKGYYEDSVSSFFGDWRSLMDFKDLLEDLSPRDTAQIFGTGGIFKKAVIYKMVNHKIYNEYLDKTVQNLLAAKESNPEEIQYQRFYSAALLMKERLASRDLPS